MCDEISRKPYDYLDYRKPNFDSDVEVFAASVRELLRRVHTMVEKEHEEVWETPMAWRMLNRFEKIAEYVPQLDVQEKYRRILSRYMQELDKIIKVYNKQCENPPHLRGMPSVAGKIQWARSLFKHLEEPMMIFGEHPHLLHIPEGKEAVKRYNRIGRTLVQYELTYYDAWRKQSTIKETLFDPIKNKIQLLLHNFSQVSYPLVVTISVLLRGQLDFIGDIEKSLRCTIVVRRPDTSELYVNWDPRITTLLHEAASIQQMGFDIPYMTQLLLNRAPLLLNKRDIVKHLLNEHRRVLAKVGSDMVPLLLPHMSKLNEALDPALTTLTWTSIHAHTFFEQTFTAIKNFETLVDRVNDIYHHRMEEVLEVMANIKLHQLPDKNPWGLETFVHNTWVTCCNAAQELNSRSQVVEDAVLELMELVLTGVEGDEKGGPFSLEDLDDSNADFDDLRSSGGSSSRRSPVPSGGASTGTGPTTTQGPVVPTMSPGRKDEQQYSSLLDLPNKPLTAQEKAQRKKKEMRERVETAAKDLRRTYHRRVLEVLVRSIKAALDAIRKHTTVTKAYSQDRIEDEDLGVPLCRLNASLMSPGIRVSPTLDQVQEAVNRVARIILSTAKGVSQWTTEDQTGEGQDQIMTASAKRKSWRGRDDVREVPPTPKNYFNHVFESKDIVKVMSLLANSIQTTKLALNNTFEHWDKYHYLWRMDKEVTIKEFVASSPSLQEYDRILHSYVLLKKQIIVEPGLYRIGALEIVTGDLKKSLMQESDTWIERYGEAVKTTYLKEMERLFAQLNELSRRLERPLKDLDDIKGAIDILRKTRDLELDMDDAIDPIEYNQELTQEEADRVDNLRFTWQKVLAQAVEVQNLLSKVQPYFSQFKKDCAAFCHDYRTQGPMVTGLAPREASDRLIVYQIQSYTCICSKDVLYTTFLSTTLSEILGLGSLGYNNRFDTLWRKHSSYSVGEELFRLPRSEFPELAQIRKELNLLQKLYKLYNDVIDRVTSYYDIPWGEVNIEEINNELMEFQNRCRKLPKALKEWPAFISLKKTIDDFNDMCPLLELMSNKAMKSRHWQRIAEVINTPLDVEEKDIEAKLRIVTNEWANYDLTFSTFKNRGELLLRGDTTAEVITQLEDSLMVLGSLLSNRYNAPFRKQIQKWVSDLSNTNEILERWLFVQNLWVYLEAVFVGGDIAKQLPKEAKRFYVIDKNWQKIMARAHDNPNVVGCCVGDDMLKELLPYLQDQLELCQKSLSGYLEKKRLMFPRFFFVSDPALLEILGQASDSHTIQAHLLSIFDNTKSVRFNEQDYDKITAILSSEGEVIQLERPVRAEGSVEIWLMKLLVMSQQSVHGIIRQAHHVIQDPDLNVLRFLEQFPAQVGILGLQMIWTRDSEMALMQARTDRRVMADMNNRFLDLLNLLINQTTRDLEPVQRTKYETLITIHIHQRDIFDSLEDVDKTNIVITDVTFVYQNEFVGCTERLVITPLTDRCYITLAQALSMSMGACPTGPAGTGKTETTKDMGKTLGKYVVVFNCSDQMDYRGLGRIYKGLCQSGSWGCFDEFNRIELPVLSVAAQQIAVVHGGRKERRKKFTFTDGDVIDMNPEFGIFLTMNMGIDKIKNLGYHGRQELPENLKIQFRNVAMMVPDRQIIIRVKLASCGFLENITLARKFFTLYKLCEEQLTKQVHYDFGLRNILSVLRTLGAAKRANPKDSESTIVMRVLRDMNLSKLVDEDEPLFMSLINDLFPNTPQEKGHYLQLTTAIAEVVNEIGLINHPPWTLKLIQVCQRLGGLVFKDGGHCVFV
ncbi:dynein axonemal heavy chain 5-like [Oratosquilla oratoria]|uniref:dynein axonemal heavy chain 5-like n=1 Tax=Oratosquilla oratoria TaxID=337810 RepID=UPI003F7576C8